MCFSIHSLASKWSGYRGELLSVSRGGDDVRCGVSLGEEGGTSAS